MNLSISDYEIGNQKYFDYLEFYSCLIEEKGEKDENFISDTSEYHHSLFYPIFRYCITVLNSSDKAKLEKIKYKIGIDDKKNIYVSVGRDIFDLFIMEEKDSIDEHEISFDSGKENFDLYSPHKGVENSTNKKFNVFFELPTDTGKTQMKEIVDNKAKELNISVEQLIKIKKKNIITKFLKGYSHQERVLKSFEARIDGKFIYLPNLIFKRKNDDGRTIEELDQIYLIKDLKTTQIKGFDVFYYKDYSKEPYDEKILYNSKPLDLENDTLYFIEIKKSITKLKSSLKTVEDKLLKNNNENVNPMPSKSSRSSKSSKSKKYKRENLTDIGNTILTSNIFADLIHNLTNRNYKINILYIVDDEFDIEMVETFSKCLSLDEKIIEDNKKCKINLIYTQPDMALRDFIRENNTKNEKIKSLEQKIDEYREEIRKFKENIDYMNKRLLYLSQFHVIDSQVIDFCERIKTSKNLISIGIMKQINEKYKYQFTSISSTLNLFTDEAKKEYILVDLATFNYISFENLTKNYNIENAINSYIEEIVYFLVFEELYLLVDFAFITNFRKILCPKILINYIIEFYMFDQYYFILYLKKVEKEKIIKIKFYKNKCTNPMLDDESSNNTLEDMEHFVDDYYFLLRERKKLKDPHDENSNFIIYLFNYESQINYILTLYKNSNFQEAKKDNYIQINSAKCEYNYLIDCLDNEFLEKFKFKNVIFVRKTEFGKKYNKEKIEKIIKYLLNSDSLIIEDRTDNEPKLEESVIQANIKDKEGNEKGTEIEKNAKNKKDKENAQKSLTDINNEKKKTIQEISKLNVKDYEKIYLIEKEKYTKANLLRIFIDNSVLPIIVNKNDLQISLDIVPLIEYNYFILIPLLLTKKDKNPETLLLANDFGILNHYYKKSYDKILNIESFIEKNFYDKIDFDKLKEYFLIDNSIKIMNFEEVIESRIKKVNSNLNNYDLIILEYFNKNDITIPNIDLLTKLNKILNYNGLLVFNLRAESFRYYTNAIKKLKEIYQTVKEINIRICSSIIICSHKNEIEFENYYKYNSSVKVCLDYNYLEKYFPKKKV